MIIKGAVPEAVKRLLGTALYAGVDSACALVAGGRSATERWSQRRYYLRTSKMYAVFRIHSDLTPARQPMYAVFRIHSGLTYARQQNVCCFSHTFGPHACAPAKCMLFFAYIRTSRLRASKMYAVFRIHNSRNTKGLSQKGQPLQSKCLMLQLIQPVDQGSRFCFGGRLGRAEALIPEAFE